MSNTMKVFLRYTSKNRANAVTQTNHLKYIFPQSLEKAVPAYVLYLEKYGYNHIHNVPVISVPWILL